MMQRPTSKYLKNTYEQPSTQADSAQLQAFLDKFTAAMDEDFNAANGLRAVAKWINSGTPLKSRKPLPRLEVRYRLCRRSSDADIERLIDK